MQLEPIAIPAVPSIFVGAELVRLGLVSIGPDRDVHPMDVPWWVAEQERAEIRAELARSELL